MRSCFTASLVLLVLLFGLPWLSVPAQEEEGETPPVEQASSADDSVTLTVWDGSDFRV